MKADRRWWNDGRLDRERQADVDHRASKVSILGVHVIDHELQREIDEKMIQWMYERTKEVFGVR